MLLRDSTLIPNLLRITSSSYPRKSKQQIQIKPPQNEWDSFPQRHIIQTDIFISMLRNFESSIFFILLWKKHVLIITTVLKKFCQAFIYCFIQCTSHFFHPNLWKWRKNNIFLHFSFERSKLFKCLYSFKMLSKENVCSSSRNLFEYSFSFPKKIIRSRSERKKYFCLREMKWRIDFEDPKFKKSIFCFDSLVRVVLHVNEL